MPNKENIYRYRIITNIDSWYNFQSNSKLLLEEIESKNIVCRKIIFAKCKPLLTTFIKPFPSSINIHVS